MITEIAKIEKDLEKMRDNIYNTFDTFLGANKPRTDTEYRTEWIPDADVTEDKDGFTLYLALPGVKKDAVDTEVKENVLVISGKRGLVENNQNTLIRQEIPAGRFYRAFNLGTRIKNSAVKAEMRDGILEVRLPKSDEAKPTRIQIE